MLYIFLKHILKYLELHLDETPGFQSLELCVSIFVFLQNSDSTVPTPHSLLFLLAEEILLSAKTLQPLLVKNQHVISVTGHKTSISHDLRYLTIYLSIYTHRIHYISGYIVIMTSNWILPSVMGEVAYFQSN